LPRRTLSLQRHYAWREVLVYGHDVTDRSKMKRWCSLHKELLFLWLFALLLWWIRYHPFGFEGVVFDGDAAQHVYWTARFQDPQLFVKDLPTEFLSSPLRATLGYHLLYRVGAAIMDPLQWSQIITLVAILFSLSMINHIMLQWSTGPLNRLIAGILFLLYYMHNGIYSFLGGFSRTFSVPSFLLFCILLQTFSPVLSLVVPICGVFLYPPISLNMLALFGYHILQRWIIGEKYVNVLRDLFIFTVVVYSIKLFIFIVYQPYYISFGPLVTKNEASQMPELNPGGRIAFFHPNFLIYLLYNHSGLGFPHFGGLCILLLLVILVVKWKYLYVPFLSWGIIWTSLGLFIWAHLTLFHLYFPSRYAVYTLPLAIIFILGSNAQRCYNRVTT